MFSLRRLNSYFRVRATTPPTSRGNSHFFSILASAETVWRLQDILRVARAPIRGEERLAGAGAQGGRAAAHGAPGRLLRHGQHQRYVCCFGMPCCELDSVATRFCFLSRLAVVRSKGIHCLCIEPSHAKVPFVFSIPSALIHCPFLIRSE